MNIPSIDEARNISSKKYETNISEWKNIITNYIAKSISNAAEIGKFRCVVDLTYYPQDDAFYDVLTEIGNDMEKQGYDILYTTSGDETEDSFMYENIRISWY